MQIHVKSGSSGEQPEENGLTFLMQEACSGGTTSRSREGLAEALELKGGLVVKMETGRTKTSFCIASVKRHAEEMFSVLTDMVRHPAFEADEIEKAKKRIAQSLGEEDDSPVEETKAKFYETAFTGQPMGANPKGSRDLLASFTPEQVRRKHAELLAHPENIIISFTGDIDEETARKLAEDYFGDLSAAAPAAAPQARFTEGDLREEADTAQINLEFGFEAPRWNDPDRYTALMLEEYVAGATSSPLFYEVREKRGLVYHVHGIYEAFSDTGYFRIGAGTGKGNAGELISVSMNVLGQVAREGVSEAELARCRERILRGITGSSERADDSCIGNAGQVVFQGRAVPSEEVTALLENVTSDDIRRICANMLKDGKYALSGIGPQETMPAEQEIQAMMRAQLAGVSIPAAPANRASAKAKFSPAAKKEEILVDKPQVTVLKNGMKVVTVERPGLLSCGFWVGVGADNEMLERERQKREAMERAHLAMHTHVVINGSFHAIEHLVFKGAKSYSADDISQIIEGELGGDLNAYTDYDKTAYFFYNLVAGGLAQAIDVCGEMVFAATLDHDEFDGKLLTQEDGSTVKAKGERDVIIEEIKMYADDIDSVLIDGLIAAAYADQPHGQQILGTEETMHDMSVEQLSACRDTFYVPSNAVLCAVGPVKHEDVVALAEEKYGDMPAGDFPPLPPSEYKGRTVFIEHPQVTDLCRVGIAAPGASYSDSDMLAYDALVMLLGQGKSSRLNKKIVNELELSAEVDTGAESYRNGGMLSVIANMPADKIKPFVTAVYAEMRGLAENLGQEEMEKVKATMEMAVLYELETSMGACNAYACNVQSTGKAETPAEVSAKIQALTIDDIKRVAGKVLSANPTLLAVVSPGTDPRLLPQHEEVIAARDGKPAAPQKTAPRTDIRKFAY